MTLPRVWRGFDPKRLWPLLVGGLIGVPVGVLLLQWLDPTVFKFGLGVFLLIYCPLLLLLPAGYTRRHGGRIADAASGLVGGVLGGIGGMSGPVPTLWTTLRGWDKDTQRGVLQAFNIAMHVSTLTAYAISGSITAQALTMFALDYAGAGGAHDSGRVAVPAAQGDRVPPDYPELPAALRRFAGVGKCRRPAVTFRVLARPMFWQGRSKGTFA
ncbi:sulfite exporter TauE/SafE family protein [Devosia sp. A8/3-2]|nr:sulfite exporter TauE/SafE family protein [Devosia sp. A8/3-2]